MTHYVIGDLQGCLEPLERLLSKVSFSTHHDHLVFCGDLVNRGPASLGTLRFIKSLGSAATVTLGNHDLHLLAAAQSGNFNSKDTLQDIMKAPDCEDLLMWLIRQPLAWQDTRSSALVIHAGVPPQWDRVQTLALAREASAALQGQAGKKFFAEMYGDQPDHWDENLKGMPRLRFIINCLTRLRYCDGEGRLHLKPKGGPGSQPKGLMPWFEVPGRKTAQDTIIFGHWSTLGQIHWPQSKVYGLDTGCVWGGCLTALNLDKRQLVSIDCEQYRRPG
jgi:bis(5'-nucleosyl)-tetraphosphatase (symmetrical)